jgi:hypothetical protein
MRLGGLGIPPDAGRRLFHPFCILLTFHIHCVAIGFVAPWLGASRSSRVEQGYLLPCRRRTGRTIVLLPASNEGYCRGRGPRRAVEFPFLCPRLTSGGALRLPRGLGHHPLPFRSVLSAFCVTHCRRCCRPRRNPTASRPRGSTFHSLQNQSHPSHSTQTRAR